MYKVTRPLEYICFFPAEFPTLVDGDVKSSFLLMYIPSLLS